MRTRRKVFLSLISTVLTIAMLACFPITASASEEGQSTPAGTAISNATELAALNGVTSGEYYLADNITADGTIESFSGTLNGNGKTVTVSAPLFGTFSGTLKNLTVEGSVTTSVTVSEVAYASPVVCYANAEATFTNITNKASVTVGGKTHTGGIVACANGALTATDCANSGDLTSGNGFVGGIVGNSLGVTTIQNCSNSGDILVTIVMNIGGIIGQADKGITLKSCVNDGNVTQTTVGKYNIGGIVGRSVGGDCTIDYCVNNGDITGIRAGGIGGELSTANTNQSVKYCLNTGTVAQINVTDNQYLGGMVSYIYCEQYEEGVTEFKDEIIGCVNAGKVIVDDNNKYASAFCGYANGDLLFKNNISLAPVESAQKSYATNWFNKYGSEFRVGSANNYILEGTADAAFRSGAGTYSEDWNTDIIKAVTAEQLASGEIAYALIQAGAEYGQLIGKDAYPIPASEYTVTKVGEKYANVLKGNASGAEAYIQFSDVNAGKQSVRVLFCVKTDGLASVENMKIKVSITNASGTKGTTVAVTKYFSSVMASGYSWVAEDGYGIVGLAVNGVPEFASGDSVSFELISGDGTNTAYNASASYTK